MVDEDGFGPTPLQVKMKKKNQAYQDRHLHPIGENSEVMRHSEMIRVEFRYFSTPVAGEARNPVPLLYELVKKMFSVAPSIVLQSVNSDQTYFSKIEGFPNSFEVEEFFKVVYNIDAVRKTGKIFVYFKIYSLVGIRVDTLKQKPGFMSFLRDNNLFMNMHQYETYAISTVGHVFKRLPDATNCQEYKEMLEKKIRSAQEEKAGQTSSTLTIPMLKIEVQTARVIHLLRDHTGQVTEKGDTYAIRVRCERDKVKEVSSLLTSGICNDSFTGTFVPITAAIGSPDGYMKLVDEHEDYRKNHSFIRISGLHPELVQAHIFDSSDNTTRVMKASVMGWKENGSNLVLYMEPSLNVTENGEWRAVVKNNNIAIAMEKLGKIKQDAERHEKYRSNINENECYRNGINISSSTVVDTETMSYVEKLTGTIDAKTAETRRAQRISNTAPTASVFLFGDSMSGQGHSQASVASRNAWTTSLPIGNQTTTPTIRNIHQQRGGGLNNDSSGRSGGRGLSRENSDMSLTLLSDNETIQSQLTRVEKTMANYERLIITQNAKLDRQTAEIRSQKDEIALMRQEQTDTNNNASTVSTMLERLMNRLVDIEQGRTPIGPRMSTDDTAIAIVPTNARKRIQLNTPVQSPAKPYVSRLGLETPESYHRKRREALEAAMEASIEAERLAFEAINNGEEACLPADPDPHNELCLGIIGVDGKRIIGSDSDTDDDEDSNDIAAQYNFHNKDDDDDDDNDVSMTTTNNVTDHQNSMIEDDPEDHGPSGMCG
jgi:hypothetical protein